MEKEMKLPTRKQIDCTVSPSCTKCGKSIFLATFALTKERVSEILTQIGWQLNPVICKPCLCPMEFWEMKRAEELTGMQRDIFKFQMIDKYGEQVKGWFL